MRWDELFDDLESQLELGISAEQSDLAGEEERHRLGGLSVLGRLAVLHSSYGRTGYSVSLLLVDGTRLRVRPAVFGADWISADVYSSSAEAGEIAGGSARHYPGVIPLGAIYSVTLDAVQVELSLAQREGGHPSRALALPLSVVLRDLCRRRRAVDVVLGSTELHGTIDRVGRDHLDLAVHERGVPRRSSAVSEYRLVPLAGLVLLRLLSGD